MQVQFSIKPRSRTTYVPTGTLDPQRATQPADGLETTTTTQWPHTPQPSSSTPGGTETIESICCSVPCNDANDDDASQESRTTHTRTYQSVRPSIHPPADTCYFHSCLPLQVTTITSLAADPTPGEAVALRPRVPVEAAPRAFLQAPPHRAVKVAGPAGPLRGPAPRELRR